MYLDNTALVTHRGCLDGSTCALVFLAAGGKEENIYFTFPQHDDSDDIVNYLAETHDGPIFVADMSISLGLATKLDQRGVDITLLDHHATAIPLNKFDWCEIEVENQRAGGKMLYDFLNNNMKLSFRFHAYNRLVELADDNDRWVRQYPESQDLVTFHDAIEQDAFIERFRKEASVKFNKEEQYLIDAYKAKRERYVERKKRSAVFFSRKLQGHNVRVGLVEAGTHQSILGNSMCEDPELDCDIAVMCSGRSVNLRSSDRCPVDLSKIAKINGGGGHFRAAATSIGKVLGEDFAELVYGKMQWGSYSS